MRNNKPDADRTQFNHISLDDPPNFNLHLPELEQLIKKDRSRLFIFIHPFYMQLKDKRLAQMGAIKYLELMHREETGFGYPDPIGSSRVTALPDFDRTRITSIGYVTRLKNLLPQLKVVMITSAPSTISKYDIPLLRALGFRGIFISYPSSSGSPNPEMGLKYENIGHALSEMGVKYALVGGQLHLPGGCVQSFIDNTSPSSPGITYVTSMLTYPYHEK